MTNKSVMTFLSVNKISVCLYLEKYILEYERGLAYTHLTKFGVAHQCVLSSHF